MDVNDLINALNQILNMGDQLDNAGGGVKRLTDGAHTTREACRMELSQFLLYIADGCSYVNDSQAAVVNIVLGEEYSDVPAYKIQEVAKGVNAPDPNMNMTVMAFRQADFALSRKNGEDSSSLTDLLISVYEMYGLLMVAANENPIARSRYDRIISKLKTNSSSDDNASANDGSGSVGRKVGRDADPDAGSKTANSSGRTKSVSTGRRKAAAGNKSKTKATSEDNAAKGTQAAESYNEIIQFELPDGYRMIWEDKDDGSKQCKIVYGEYTDDNGSTAYQFFATVSDMDIESTEEDTIPAGEKPFETLQRRDPGRRSISISNDPPAELQVKETPVNLLGSIMKVYALVLLVQVSPNKLSLVMRIDCWDDEDNTKNVGSYEHMIVMANSLRYKGQALPARDLSAGELMEKLKPDFDGKGSVVTSQVGVKVQVNGETVSETHLTGDDEGNVHIEDDHHAPNKLDGKYTGYLIKEM